MAQIFIPILKYQNGSVEVFTTKFSGLYYDNLKDAKIAVKTEPQRFWHCETKDVAKMRARDKTKSLHANEAEQKAKPLFIEV